MNTNLLSNQTLDCFSEKTYDKILKESLILFNDAGFNSITTAYISKKCDILEGTLWYHFNSKKNILNAHIKLFQKLFQKQVKKIDYNNIENVFGTSFDIYSLIWDFQYIFREHFESFTNDNEILQKIKKVNSFVDEYIEEMISKSQKSFLNIKKNVLEKVVDTTLLIGRYWLHFSKKRYPKLDNKKLRVKGVKLIYDSIEPFLDNKGKKNLSCLYKKFMN